MSVLGIVLLVLGILVVVGLGVGILLFFLLGKSKATKAALAQELAADPALRGPESAIYRGSTGGYSKVMGNGQIALTQRRLIFRKLTGGAVDVDLTDVTGVQTSKSFNRSVVGNRVHLVVSTANGDVGYFVSDTDGWAAAIRSAAPRLRGAQTP
jgi:hypothetical protein